jgi:acetyl esterase
MKKILKYLALFLLVLAFGIIVYVYSLTFRPEGRLDWGQALFLKMLSFNATDGSEPLKSLEERRHFFDFVPYDNGTNTIDSMKVTEQNLPLYIFKPKNLRPNAPVIFYLHGGAFKTPWNNTSQQAALRYARYFDALVVGLDYRVAPEFPYPNSHEDAYEGLLWVIDNIKKHGGDPQKIIVAGESSGATIAALVAIKARDEGLTNIKYQIFDCINADDVRKYPSADLLKKGYFPENDIEGIYGYYLPKKEDQKNPKVWPLNHDLKGLPPAYISTTEFDFLKDTCKEFYKKLKAEGTPAYYNEEKGMVHCMIGAFNEGDLDKLYAEIAQEAQKYVK